MLRIGLQAELERRILFEQQLGQHLPDGWIGQRLHVGIAQLRAVAAACAHGGARRAVHHGDAVACLLQNIGGGEADDACADDADVLGLLGFHDEKHCSSVTFARRMVFCT